jgi:hypothetical protein
VRSVPRLPKCVLLDVFAHIPQAVVFLILLYTQVARVFFKILPSTKRKRTAASDEEEEREVSRLLPPSHQSVLQEDCTVDQNALTTSHSSSFPPSQRHQARPRTYLCPPVSSSNLRARFPRSLPSSTSPCCVGTFIMGNANSTQMLDSMVQSSNCK